MSPAGSPSSKRRMGALGLLPCAIFACLGFVLPSGLTACGGASGSAKAPPKTIGTNAGFKNATRCETDKPDREVSYHDLAGTGHPDMVEVISYKKGASGISEGHPVCMELDTNRDDVLDLLRVFTDLGEIESEEADRNYDTKSDIWITYEHGLIAKQAFDVQYKGVADEFHYYRDGKLKRIERDRNDDGKIDVWEFYTADARLERMGIDQNLDGKVDVWYRDEVARAEQKKQAAASSSASASAAPSSSAPPSKKKTGNAE